MEIMTTLTEQQIGELVARLQPGGHFAVRSDSERKIALGAGKIMGRRLTSRKNGGEYVIFALPVEREQ